MKKGYLNEAEAKQIEESDFNITAPLMWMLPAYEQFITSDARMDKVRNSRQNGEVKKWGEGKTRRWAAV